MNAPPAGRDFRGALRSALSALAARRPEDATACRRALELLDAGDDPWDRRSPRHLTASALVLDPATSRVLLRWHPRLSAWLQLGGHAEPGETDALQIALREAREESGLADPVPWPPGADAAPLQCALVPVPAGGGEPAHEHVDIRFLFATGTPGAVTSESPEAPLRWLGLDEAIARTAGDRLQQLLQRVAEHGEVVGPAGLEPATNGL